MWGLVLRVVVLAELPRTRETLLLRLLGARRLLREAFADRAALPDDAWEKTLVAPLLVHFKLGAADPATDPEDDMSAEIRAWFEDYKQKLRAEASTEGHAAGRESGIQEGLRTLLLRQLHARFGKLPEAAVARIDVLDDVG